MSIDYGSMYGRAFGTKDGHGDKKFQPKISHNVLCMSNVPKARLYMDAYFFGRFHILTY